MNSSVYESGLTGEYDRDLFADNSIYRSPGELEHDLTQRVKDLFHSMDVHAVSFIEAMYSVMRSFKKDYDFTEESLYTTFDVENFLERMNIAANDKDVAVIRIAWNHTLRCDGAATERELLEKVLCALDCGDSE